MSIVKVVVSVQTLHGGERDQVVKYGSYLAWQLAQRAKAAGKEPSSILKQDRE